MQAKSLRISTLDTRVLMTIMDIMNAITPRQLDILDFIIREFINSARPIGSACVANQGRFNLSTATLRNEMNNLEDAGYLMQLHTSGGRVPTDKAYRLFVDDIVANYELVPKNNYKVKINLALDKSGNDPNEINKNIAKTLSDLSDNLVITGITKKDDFYKIGLSSLFNMPEFREFDKAFQLTSFFDEFENMFNEIQKVLFSHLNDMIPEVRIMIGRENHVRNISGETIMCAKYPLPGMITGSLTLIGPTRMDYEKNLSLIKYTVDRLNNKYFANNQ